MPCYHPQTGYRSQKPNANGKYPIVFSKTEGWEDRKVTITCGNCIGCRLEDSRQWAIRATHEASLYGHNNCFITLTYDKENLPKHSHLDYNEPVLFMKKLRDKYGPNIRSFGCAEYGETCGDCGKNKTDCYIARKTGTIYKHDWEPTAGRPHYHICLFNHDWTDKQYKFTKKKNKYYSSESLTKLWGKGIAITTGMSWETAAYVGRYVTKKIKGKGAKQEKGRYGLTHYQHIEPVTGEILDRPPERSICISRRPGLGRPWFEKYYTDCYPKDYLHLRGKKIKPPKYYDDLYEKIDPKSLAKIKRQRRLDAQKKAEETTADQLNTKEIKHQKSAKKLVREFQKLDGENNHDLLDKNP